MSDLPQIITNSKIWKSTLGVRDEDPFPDARERLRTSFVMFRERVKYLADLIRTDVPELTVHDITHLDSLWDISSIIVGDTYTFTPTEAFAFGGAVLLHDLAMSTIAIEGGYLSIKKDPLWTDLVISEYQLIYDRFPTKPEILNPEKQVHDRVLFNFLRQVHAEKAEKLAFLSYPSPDKSPLFLIEDTEIRQTFGVLIGLIAHSHWWSVEEVEKKFNRVIGASPWCPREWVIDPLKISCVLRLADAAHLDASRAPVFMKALTDMSPSSEAHWRFQEKLNKPYLREDALVFTTGAPFRLADASSWWLCLETLRTLDRELRSVDAMFAEKGYARFAARRVAGVDLPDRLKSYVQTEGWVPVNAMIHVTDLPAVIKSLGGEELYGKNPHVPLRELIQNASDAVRARTFYESREPGFGRVYISLAESPKGDFWLEVMDNGVGMSQRVLTEFLLDFGRTYWGSALMQEEFPGLLSKGFKSIGKYGIGFFSAFMVADHVQVVTRRSNAAVSDTIILEFSSGLEGRPILRTAKKDEQLIDGGTRVRLKLTKNPHEKGGLLYTSPEEKELSIGDLCLQMCPSSDVDVYILENGKLEKIISANDWQKMDGVELLKRIEFWSHETVSDESVFELRKRAGSNLRLLQNDKGEIFGRACISIGTSIMTSHLEFDLRGVVTIGGLKACSLSGIIGILLGQPTRSSREAARPIVPDDVLKSWAEDQAELVPQLWKNPIQQSECAQYIRMCGGSTKELPIAIYKGKWVSAEELSKMDDPPEIAIIVDHFHVDSHLNVLNSYALEDNVFVTGASGIPGLLQGDHRDKWPPFYKDVFILNTLAGAVIESLSMAWNVPFDNVLAVNDLKRDEIVKVAREGEREIKLRAIKLVRPSSSK